MNYKNEQVIKLSTGKYLQFCSVLTCMYLNLNIK